MNGKIVVATGATSGIGAKAVEALARIGARIVFVARDRAKADQTLARLEAIAPGLGHKAHLADLSLMRDDEARRLGDRRVRTARRRPRQQRRGDVRGSAGYGRGIGAHLRSQSHVLFHLDETASRQCERGAGGTHRLHRLGRASGRRARFRRICRPPSYSGFRAYRRSKLANILFTRVARRSKAERDRQLSASRRRRFAFRGRGRRMGARVAFKWFAISPEGRRHSRLILLRRPTSPTSVASISPNEKSPRPSGAARDSRGEASVGGQRG